MTSTMRAAGSRVRAAPGVHVRRLPPTAGQFAGRRTRQAYDSLARPVRLTAELTLLPATAFAAAARRWTVLAGAAAERLERRPAAPA